VLLVSKEFQVQQPHKVLQEQTVPLDHREIKEQLELVLLVLQDRKVQREIPETKEFKEQQVPLA
jgi:hypothetical protein